MKKDIYIKALEYGNKVTKGFNYDELIAAIKPLEWEKDILRQQIELAYHNWKLGKNEESLFWCIDPVGGGNGLNEKTKYVLSLFARFKYLDYLELQTANKTSRAANQNSKNAQELAIKSNKIATFAVIAAIFVPLITGWESIVKLFCLIFK